MRKSTEVIGYLPDERPVTWKLLLYALQQVIVMFPRNRSSCAYHRFSGVNDHFCQRFGDYLLYPHNRQKDPALLWVQLFLPDCYREYGRGAGHGGTARLV